MVHILHGVKMSHLRPPTHYCLERRPKPVWIQFTFCQMKTSTMQFCYLINPKPGLFHLHIKEMSPEHYLFWRDTALTTQIFKKMRFGE